MKHQEKVTILLLTAVYLLCGIRYFPDHPLKTALNTALNLLTVAPFIIGALFILISVLKKTSGQGLAAVKIARLYLSMGIVIEFFVGIYHYLKING